MGKPKLSRRLEAERRFVEEKLEGLVICDRCQATLERFGPMCIADLSDPCPGFMRIEATKCEFEMQIAKGGPLP